jgi:isopenicillin-N epimerase
MRTLAAPSRFRALWGLAPGTVFLNHGSFGACPRAVLDFQSELRRRMEAEPVQFLWRRYEELLEPARVSAARFVGASPKDFVFTTNATAGVNSVIRSLELKPGDEILTTSHDYNACRNVLIESARRARARVVVAEIPFPLRAEDQVVEAILKSVTRRTRLAMIDHVTSNTALVLPVARLVRELHERGVDALVDGAHAPGMVPLDLNQLGAAYYTANLHKWTCAPKGAAFLWVRQDKQDAVQPAVISHGNNRPRPGFTPFQDRFDWTGTFDLTAWLCVPPAIQFMGKLLTGGWSALRKRNHELAVKARQDLCAELHLNR